MNLVLRNVCGADAVIAASPAAVVSSPTDSRTEFAPLSGLNCEFRDLQFTCSLGCFFPLVRAAYSCEGC